MRKLAVAPGAVLLAVALLPVVVPTPTDPSTPTRDRTPALCLSVPLRSGQQVLRLQDRESGVRGFSATPVGNLVLARSSVSFPMPLSQTDVRVWRPTPGFRGAAMVRHINGAGVEGACLVTSDAPGTLTAYPWP